MPACEENIIDFDRLADDHATETSTTDLKIEASDKAERYIVFVDFLFSICLLVVFFLFMTGF